MAWIDRNDVAVVVGSSLVQRPVWAVLVVVSDVLDEQGAELAFVPDDGSVEEFVAKGPHPPFGERVRLR